MGAVPIDESHGHPVPHHNVERAWIAVDHARSPSGEFAAAGQIMQLSEDATHGCTASLVALRWMVGRGTIHERQDVTALLIDTQVARCPPVPAVVQLAQHPRCEHRPPLARSPNGVAVLDHAGCGVAAGENLFHD
jgi:hypothetical protein